ncbi:HD-GYP domain-containing protein [Caenispirillum bisanense]|uniref:Putative two-component system response regulator n=1 Tax=Caenispirillum bisanense TaxID=414052 RepID=A0A286GWG7_9PROT|nr:two-component system response regulator [Caenispirillum bisanense]SOD99897.1 putative two-component system response regulator [Caenispirillum bisanense]
MTPSERLLIVDDEPINVKVLVDLLRDSHALVVAKDGPQALSRLEGDVLPDLVLLDVMMPGMDGIEVCRRIKADPRTADIPVIFVTALGQTHDETLGFATGAVDYITKPISPPVVLARVATHLSLRRAKAALRDQNAALEDRVRQRTRDLERTQDVTIRALASLAETRDNETGNHIRRTQHYVRRLAEALRDHPRFAAALDERTIDLLFKSAPLHDIGKVGIPDRILLKPGKLDDGEFTVMKQHAALGRAAIENALEDDGTPERGGFLRYAMEIAAGHHERWDGTGYPAGLAGDAIPLSARLMAVADVYDALISRRVYKPAWTHEQAVDMIARGRGSHFDPDIVDAFLAIAEDFRTIAATYADELEDDAIPEIHSL